MGKAQFDESRFKPLRRYAEDYYQRVRQGLERAAGRTALVALSRNCPSISEHLEAKLELTGKLFAGATYFMAGQARVLDPGDVDVVILIDPTTDSSWSYEGLAHTLSYWGSWDAVASNGFGLKLFGRDEDYALQRDAAEFRQFGSWAPPSVDLFAQQRWYRGEPLVPVFSAFGGLIVYRAEVLRRVPLDLHRLALAGFHRKLHMSGFGRTFINPSQLVVY